MYVNIDRFLTLRDATDLISVSEATVRSWIRAGRPTEYRINGVWSLRVSEHELLSRVRAQLRNKHAADEFHERLRVAEESRNTTQQVVTAVNEERRTLRRGGLATVAFALVAGLAVLFLIAAQVLKPGNAKDAQPQSQVS